MIPQRALILRISDNKNSLEYSKTCSDSCDGVGLQWEYVEGYSHKKFQNEKKDLWKEVQKDGIKFTTTPKISGAGAFCTAGHYKIWKKIVDDNICSVILEHDAIMLHKPNIDIEDGVIGVLGYKVKDPHNYNHISAGPPSVWEDRKKHGGAHAYCLTPETAKTLLRQLEKKPKPMFIDNAIFLSGGWRGDCKLKICDPICALGWLRESTIWAKSAIDNHKPLLKSFENNYHSKESLGLK